mgnify:CR=1 FL=1
MSHMFVREYDMFCFDNFTSSINLLTFVLFLTFVFKIVMKDKKEKICNDR